MANIILKGEYQNKILTGAGVQPTVSNPVNAVPGDGNWVDATDILEGQFAHNITDDKWYYRTSNTIKPFTIAAITNYWKTDEDTTLVGSRTVNVKNNLIFWPINEGDLPSFIIGSKAGKLFDTIGLEGTAIILEGVDGTLELYASNTSEQIGFEIVGGSGCTFKDNSTVKNGGIKEDADYSATYTDLSLVNRGYVFPAIAALTDGATVTTNWQNKPSRIFKLDTVRTSLILDNSNFYQQGHINVIKNTTSACAVTIQGTGYKFVDMDNKTVPATSIVVTLTNTTTGMPFEIDFIDSGRLDGGSKVIWVKMI